VLFQIEHGKLTVLCGASLLFLDSAGDFSLNNVHKVGIIMCRKLEMSI
jgi:hypothetical protein